MRRAAVVAALAALALIGLLAPGASAQTPGSAAATTTTPSGPNITDPNAVVAPPTLLRPPKGRRLSGRAAERIADGVPKIVALRRDHPRATREAFLKGTDRWQVSYYDPDEKEIGQVIIDDTTGAVQEAWTGYQVAWTMARGYPGAFGRKATALWVWLPLLVLFVVPFVNWRRPLSMRHLDLAVLASLSISLAFFSHANIGMSVPLAYPVLLYLLGRMLFIGLRGRRDGDQPLHLLIPVRWLAVGVLFLAGFRIGLNVVNSNVIDVGYSGVIGAHKILHGQALYGHFPTDDPHGDTYGPVNYLAYVPWVAALGWSGHWDDLPAAHGAALTFDLATLLVLWLLGRKLGGSRLAWALAWAWVAYPFTLFVSNSNANDSLVALLVSLALLAAASAPRRGAGVALAGLAKFAPLALGPLLLAGPHGTIRARSTLRYLAGAAAAAAVVLGIVALTSGLGDIFSRTLGYQTDRGSPFSVWGLWGWTGAPEIAVQIAGVGLALVLLVVPRRRDAVAVAALAAAVLIALQLGITHWFYLYVVWFFPAVMVALLAPGGARSPSPAAAPAPP